MFNYINRICNLFADNQFNVPDDFFDVPEGFGQAPKAAISVGMIIGIISAVLVLVAIIVAVVLAVKSHKKIAENGKSLFGAIHEGLSGMGTAISDAANGGAACEYCGSRVKVGEDRCPNCGAGVKRKRK